MRVLVDMNLSPLWVGFLVGQGVDAIHWSAVGSPKAPDTVIMSWAREHASGAIVTIDDAAARVRILPVRRAKTRRN